LNNYGCERGQAKKPQPAAFFHSPGPSGEDNGEQSDEFRDHAMAMFVSHAAHHARHFVEGTEGGRPVGNGQAGVIAGDERSGNDEDKRGASGEDGEAVQSAMVGQFDAFQNSLRGKMWGDVPRKTLVYQTNCR
jgi:hypothetical protein